MWSACARVASSGTRARQTEVLNTLITKHLQDESLQQFAKGEDFTKTSCERDIQRWEHAHLIAALDTLNAYQRDRRARSTSFSVGPSMNRAYRNDPRTRLVELLKRWLRSHAASSNIDEEEVRRVSGLCRDLLNHAALFPSRNPRSFMRTMAEVYEHLQWQLREVLERDRTCAELAQRAITLSRNLLSDVIAYLMLAPTELKQTDSLPSMEAVLLWSTLPNENRRNVPVRPDAKLQQTMKTAWQTQMGSLIAAVLTSSSAVRLFKGRHAEEDAAQLAITSFSAPTDEDGAEAEPVPVLVAKAEADFAKGSFGKSGLAGPLRSGAVARQAYLNAITYTFDLAYCLGEAFVLFQRLGEGLGDYGMIRSAPWLHPFLQALVDKVHQLKGALELLNKALDEALVLAKARGLPVEKPAPTARMCQRAHEAIERAITGRDSHCQAFLRVLDDLRTRSAPERLPHVMDAIGDACAQLQQVLSSPEFFARIGDEYRSAFPKATALGEAADVLHMGGAKAIEGGRTPAAFRPLALEDSKANEEGVQITMLNPAVGRPAPLAVADAPRDGGEDPSQTPVYVASGPRTPIAFVGGGGTRSPTAGPNPFDHEPPEDRFGAESGGGGEGPVIEELPEMPATLSERKGGDVSPASPDCRRPPRLPTPAMSPPAATPAGAATGRSAASPSPSPSPAAQGILPTGGQSPFTPAAPQSAPSRGFRLQLPGRLGRSISRERAPPAPQMISSSVDSLKANVYRCTSTTSGFKRHDQRTLILAKGLLMIYQKGSTTAVKSMVDVEKDVDSCTMMHGGVMSVCLRRAAAEAGPDGGVQEHKTYFFEFPTGELAEAFRAEISRLKT